MRAAIADDPNVSLLAITRQATGTWCLVLAEALLQYGRRTTRLEGTTVPRASMRHGGACISSLLATGDEHLSLSITVRADERRAWVTLEMWTREGVRIDAYRQEYPLYLATAASIRAGMGPWVRHALENAYFGAV